MSGSIISFGCTRCDFSADSMVGWGQFTYQIGNAKFTVQRELGWCAMCNTLAPIEVLPNADSIRAIMSEKKRLLAEFEKGKAALKAKQPWLSKIVGLQPHLPHHLQTLHSESISRAKKLQSQENALEALSGRTSGPKCLICGSQDVIDLRR